MLLFINNFITQTLKIIHIYNKKQKKQLIVQKRLIIFDN